MVDVIPPDHYAALGVAKDASEAQIKTAYKKAALKFHPDKAKDKATAADQFHKISQAYETLSDEDKKRKYEEQLKIAQLKKNLQERRTSGPPPPGYGASPMRGPMPDVRYAYAPRTYGPPPTYTSPQPRFDTRRPRDNSPEDDRGSPYDETRYTGRKYPSESARSPQQSSRPANTRREEVRRPSYDQPRSKKQDQARRDDRYYKQQSRSFSDSDSDSDDVSSRRRDEDYPTRRGSAPRPRSPPHNTDPYYGSKYNNAKQYMADQQASSPSARAYSPPDDYRREAFQSENTPSREKPKMESRTSYDARPGVSRTGSSRQNVNETMSRSRTETIRDDELNSRRTPQKKPEEERRPRPPPSMQHAASSPSGGGSLPKMAETHRRSTEPPNDKPPVRREIPRSNTMPAMERSNSYTTEKAAGPRRSSADQSTQPQRPQPVHGSSHPLRQSATHDDSGYSTSNSPSEESPKKENVQYSQASFPTANSKTTRTYAYPPSSTGGGSNNTSMNVHVESGGSSSEDEEEEEEATSRSQQKPQFTQPSRASNAEVRTPRQTPASRSTSPLRQEARPEPNEGRSRTISTTNRAQLHAQHQTTNDRTKGAPPSSYSKFTGDSRGKRDQDPYHPSKHPDAPASSTSVNESGRSRRPSLGSRTQSSKAVPPLNKSKTMPTERLRLQTHQSMSSARLPYEITASPTEIFERSGKSDNEGRDSGRESGRDSGRERDRDGGRERDRDRDRNRDSRRKDKDRESDRKERKSSSKVDTNLKDAKERIDSDKRSAIRDKFVRGARSYREQRAY